MAGVSQSNLTSSIGGGGGFAQKKIKTL